MTTDVPLPVTCDHGRVVAWRYRDDPTRVDARMAEHCPTCSRLDVLRRLLDDIDAADIRRRGRLDSPDALAVRRLIDRQVDHGGVEPHDAGI